MLTTHIHRYLFKEITGPTILGLVIFTFVLLMGRYHRLVEMIIYNGVPLVDVGTLFVTLLPSLLVITVPLSFLLGIILGFGRLSSDTETTALKASGVSLIQMTKPAFALALAASILTAFLSLYLQPEWKYQFRLKLFDIVNHHATIGIQPSIINRDFDGITILANGVDSETQALTNIFIADNHNQNESSIITANKGKLVSDSNSSTIQFRLMDGTIHRMSDKKPDNYTLVNFKNYAINLNLSNQLKEGTINKKEIRDQTAIELWKAQKSETKTKKKLKLQTRLYKIIALPFTPIIFTLIGIPLGIQSNRSGKGGGAAIALLLAVSYFIMLSIAQTISKNGTIHPAIAMMTPNIICLICGLTLFIGANNEKTPTIVKLLFNTIERTKLFLARPNGEK